MSVHRVSRGSVLVRVAGSFLALLLAYTLNSTGLLIAQGNDADDMLGLLSLNDKELGEIAAQGLFLPEGLLTYLSDDELNQGYAQWWLGIPELDFFDSDIQVSGLSYGNTLTVNSAVGVKVYPLPEYIDRIVFENIRIRGLGGAGVSIPESPSIGSVSIENVHFQELNAVVTLD